MIAGMTKQRTNKPTLGILVCGHSTEKMSAKFGSYANFFEQLLGSDSFEYKAFKVVDGDFPHSINDADAWLLTGSKHGAYEPHPWIPPLENLIREIYAAQLPMAGICFGHQIMAQALGGKVEKFDGGWVAGTQRYKFSAETGASDALLNAWHQDQVVEKPADATVIGSSDNCEFAALSYRSNTVSLQPHPEFNNDHVTMLLAERGGSLPSHSYQIAEASLGQKLHNNLIANWLVQVLSGQRAA